ncbi:MAG: hypothetical protein WBK70_00550, partial [Thermacetogeniaceae bacterium]
MVHLNCYRFEIPIMKYYKTDIGDGKMRDNSKAQNIHVLLLPSWYPTRTDVVKGVFFKQQAIALK